VLATTHTATTTAFALLALRVSLGAMIMAHGFNHIFGGGRLAGTAGWFESLGMRPGRLNALAATATELSSGALLLLGLATPIAAAELIALMTVAIVTVHRKNGYFIFRPGQGIEYCLTIAIVAGVVGALGPGPWSLDHALGLWHYTRFEGLVIAVLVGVGGAAIQLLVVWRPPKPTPAG
jgi:putative oxidoreductase